MLNSVKIVISPEKEMQNARYVRKFYKLLKPWSLTNKEEQILPSEVKGITNMARLTNEIESGKQESKWKPNLCSL